MKVLVACEESQAVTTEFRRLGHEAYSCDTEPCSGGHPEWHIQTDALQLLKMQWDMIVAFPPCTYLTNAGAMRLRIDGEIVPERMALAKKAKDFFMEFYNANCSKIAIENPVPGGLHELPPYSQIIEPYMFGHPWRKKTCLWLKGLPPLFSTGLCVPKGLWVGSASCRETRYHLNGNRSAKLRSKTFSGIAKAMAEQWGEMT